MPSESVCKPESGGDRGEQWRKLVCAILKYLLRHPSARDSAEGIAQWWMSDDETEAERWKIDAALEELVNCNWIEIVESPVSDTLYSLNRERLEEVQRFVEQRCREE